MTAVRTDAAPLVPVVNALAAVRARHGEGAVHGLAPGLVVDDPAGWMPASALVFGDPAILDDLLDAAKQRWSAPAHVAVALAWKSYCYWVALPAVLGWATARRVPPVGPADVLIRYAEHQPFLQVALRRPDVVALASDPLAVPAHPAVRAVPDEAALLDFLRTTLLDAHLAPLVDRLQARVRLSRRTLLGSLAAGTAYGLSRAAGAIPGSTLDSATVLLSTLGVADLVELGELPAGGLRIQRRTCCLAFTLPEPKICASCCLRTY
jgi:ferric iron reductase protein FhuF